MHFGRSRRDALSLHHGGENLQLVEVHPPEILHAGVGAGIGIAFVEPLVGNLMRAGGSPWKDIPNYLINSNANVIIVQNKVPPALPSFGPSARDLADQHVFSVEGAAVVLAIYIVVFIALALLFYRRRDIGSAS